MMNPAYIQAVKEHNAIVKLINAQNKKINNMALAYHIKAGMQKPGANGIVELGNGESIMDILNGVESICPKIDALKKDLIQMRIKYELIRDKLSTCPKELPDLCSNCKSEIK